MGWLYGIGLSVAGFPCFYTNGVGSFDDADSTVHDGAWHHIGFSGVPSGDPGTLTFYKDGIADGTAASKDLRGGVARISTS